MFLKIPCAGMCTSSVYSFVGVQSILIGHHGGGCVALFGADVRCCSRDRAHRYHAPASTCQYDVRLRQSSEASYIKPDLDVELTFDDIQYLSPHFLRHHLGRHQSIQVVNRTVIYDTRFSSVDHGRRCQRFGAFWRRCSLVWVRVFRILMIPFKPMEVFFRSP